MPVIIQLPLPRTDSLASAVFQSIACDIMPIASAVFFCCRLSFLNRWQKTRQHGLKTIYLAAWSENNPGGVRFVPPL
jgi:hypothetical protein